MSRLETLENRLRRVREMKEQAIGYHNYFHFCLLEYELEKEIEELKRIVETAATR